MVRGIWWIGNLDVDVGAGGGGRKRGREGGLRVSGRFACCEREKR